MATLYELNEQLRAIDTLLAENEDSETLEILESAKEELNKDIDNKIETICQYMTDCDGKVESLKGEIARLQKKVKSLSNKKEFLKTVVQNHLIENNIQKADYGTYTLSLAKTAGKVILTDDAEKLLPDNLCTITRTPNKTAIKEQMVDGKYTINIDGNEVELAKLEIGTSLRIK